MPSWTKEQLLAINENGNNIIVSAGAGSGKTAVLTERVITKLKNGTSIRNLLILTFTNNAAHEMKERIKSSIKKESLNNEFIKKELDYIDNAYITTFDSYSLTIVKKYHYLLGIGNDIGIIDSNIVDLKKEEYIDNIFEQYYKEKDSSFLNLVDLLCVKDDKSLKNIILEINKKLDLLENKKDFLNNYIINYYNDEFINNIIKDYEELLLYKINNIRNLLDDLSFEVDGKYIEEFNKKLKPLLDSKDYDSIKVNSIINLGILKNATELGKEIKSEIVSTIKEINNMCYYNKEEIKNNILSTKDYLNAIINIIEKLDNKINIFKKSINKYEFKDISTMAIDIVKNNIEIKEEIKNSFDEICVDEYQDTNDLQESFINLISKNNVYMVGDIKQSIYRFRNANPIIFKNKYDLYSKNNGGIKIDLVKNFRSRPEVLEDINNIFNLIMDNYIGGAEYSESHNMIFGNNTYINEGKTKQNNYLEIYNYDYNSSINYKKEEIEAFIIGNDIKNKIKNNYKVFDKNLNTLRNVKYSDFVILMDRSTNFTLYKKVLLYLGIPSNIFIDENIVNESILFIIKNIINLIIKINNNEYDLDFKYSFISIARCFLSELNDNDIFETFKNNTYKNNKLFDLCLDISKEIDSINNVKLLDLIVDKFDFFNNIIKIGNIENNLTIIDYLYKNFKELDSIGYSISDLNNYLDNIIKNNKEIKINMSIDNTDAVNIMTIHKSKGLEFNVCYYSGFDKPFNLDDLKSKIIYDNKYGIIIPINNEGLDDLITKTIIKNNYIKDDISEKIRLFYVALTRCKEKMIIVGNFNKDNIYSLETNGVIENRIRNKYKSFKDIILSVKTRLNKYFVDISIENIGLTHEYNNIKMLDYKKTIKNNNKVIKVIENKVEKIEVINKHFSKDNLSIVDEVTKSNMNLGTYLHELFESVDFKNPDYSDFNSDEIKYINNFLNQELVKNIKESKIYKEYEFIYQNDNELLHGIIDLMLEFNDHIDIIDYKLMNTTSEEYINQLNGYKKYINTSFNKEVNIYLYSILNNEIKKIN